MLEIVSTSMVDSSHWKTLDLNSSELEHLSNVFPEEARCGDGAVTSAIINDSEFLLRVVKYYTQLLTINY